MRNVRKNMKAKYGLMQTERYKTKKKQRMTELRKLRQNRTINSARDYLVIANRVSGKDRIDSRMKVIKRGEKEANGSY